MIQAISSHQFCVPDGVIDYLIPGHHGTVCLVFRILSLFPSLYGDRNPVSGFIQYRELLVIAKRNFCFHGPGSTLWPVSLGSSRKIAKQHIKPFLSCLEGPDVVEELIVIRISISARWVWGRTQLEEQVLADKSGTGSGSCRLIGCQILLTVGQITVLIGYG